MLAKRDISCIEVIHNIIPSFGSLPTEREETFSRDHILRESLMYQKCKTLRSKKEFFLAIESKEDFWNR